MGRPLIPYLVGARVEKAFNSRNDGFGGGGWRHATIKELGPPTPVSAAWSEAGRTVSPRWMFRPTSMPAMGCEGKARHSILNLVHFPIFS